MSLVQKTIEDGSVSLEGLKKKKASYLGYVHRKAQAVESGLAKGGSVEVLMSLMAEYEEASRRFMDAHESYLEAEGDSEHRSQAVASYEAEQSRKVTLQIAAASYQTGFRGHAEADVESIISKKTSSSTRTRSSVRERKKLAEVQLKLQALTRKHELERKQEEYRREMEMLEADTEVKIAHASARIEESAERGELASIGDNGLSITNINLDGMTLNPDEHQHNQVNVSGESHNRCTHYLQSSHNNQQFIRPRQPDIHESKHIHNTPVSLTSTCNLYPDHSRYTIPPYSSNVFMSPSHHVQTSYRSSVLPFVPASTMNNFATEDITGLACQPNVPQPRFEGQRSSMDNRLESDNNAWLAVAEAIRQGPSLPKLELIKFDGNPLSYGEFKINFVNNIEAQVADPSQRLTRLLAQCTGKARDAIRSCVNLPVTEGYQRAWQILFESFGKPHMVADEYMAVLKRLEIRRADANNLIAFGRQLENTLETMRSMGPLYSGRLDNDDVIKLLMNKLPSEAMKRRWVDKAGEVIERNGQVLFVDFLEFVQRSGSRMNNAFGKELQTKLPKLEQRKPVGIDERKKMTTMSIQNKGKPKWSCFHCSGSHGIWKCSKFIELPVEEKIKKIGELGLCRACLDKGHYARSCPRSFKCRVEGCGQAHHTLIHQPLKSQNQQESSGEGNASVTSMVTSNSIVKEEKRRSKICFKILPVKVYSPTQQRFIQTNAFLDSGSDVTLCTKAFANRLGVPGRPTNYCLTTINGDQKVEGFIVDLRVSPLDEQKEFHCKGVFTVHRMPVSANHIATDQELSIWSHLQDIDVNRIENTDVDILIGSDHPEMTEDIIDIRKGEEGGPIALRTPLGWVTTGNLGKPDDVNTVFVNSCLISRETDILQQIKQLYDADFGDSKEEKSLSVEDKRALRIMEDSACVMNGHYQVKLPFKEDHPVFPDSKPVAEKRLQYLKARFKRSPDFKEKYSQVMKRYEEEGSARKLTADEIRALKNPWYLPHHAVWHPKKPGEPRVVFDCASKSAGVSLNDFLLRGPENTSTLIGVLLRFRLNVIGVTADIQRMFHQVFVAPEDRRALCYLWWPDGNIDSDPEVWSMLVNIFGAKSSPSVCGFVLRKTAHDNDGEFSQETIASVLKNFYVDDWLMSFSNKDEAIKIVGEISSLLKRGGFHLTKFNSSNRQVTETIIKEDRAPSLKDLDLSKDVLPTQRALGLQWDVEEDTLAVTTEEKDYEQTRRGVLSSVASVYDPLGFASPLILSGRRINQELCRRNWGWDDPLPPDISSQWKSWCDDIRGLNNFNIPRCFSPPVFSDAEVELHHFCDASENDGYGVSSYFRFINSEGSIHCCFLFGKSRVPPLRSGITVPKLELTAASVAVDIDGMLSRELGEKIAVSRTVFWTDSIIVIRYIRNETKRFTTFVANRVAKIRESTQVSQWRYVPSKQNVADIASRGISPKEEERLKMWKNGPDFLWQGEGHWPNQPAELSQSLAESDEGVKKQKGVVNSIIVQDDFWSKFLTKYSSWRKLRRVCAKLIRAKTKFRESIKEKSTQEDLGIENMVVVTVEELKEAEKLIARQLQKIEYSDCESNENGKVKGKLACLKPVIVEGILRVGGRLGNSFLDFDSKHPIIIPSHHHVTDLIIKHFHEINGHTGTQQVLGEVRKRFWIVSGVSTVRRVIRGCQTCKRLNARAGEQVLAPLPEIRVSSDSEGLIYPFAATGIDLFGPLHTTKGRATRSTRKGAAVNKRYGCIFTCMRYRAVHLELVQDLSTDSFINALLRFVARRGPVRILLSDNGSNFHGAEKDVLRAMKRWNQDAIKESCSSRFIRWEFNPPGASHQGDVWERLIRIVRRILHSLLKNRLVDDETLSTLLCEAEKIVNDRPITRAAEDPESLDVLTPSQILLLRGNSCTAPSEFQDKEAYKARWKEVSILANRFWQRWLKEYLPTLQERQKWLVQKRNFKVGDLVLIVDTNLPRGQWQKGLVVDTFPDKENIVRRLQIRTANGTLLRDIRKVCLLEEELIKSIETD